MEEWYDDVAHIEGDDTTTAPFITNVSYTT